MKLNVDVTLVLRRSDTLFFCFRHRRWLDININIRICQGWRNVVWHTLCIFHLVSWNLSISLQYCLIFYCMPLIAFFHLRGYTFSSFCRIVFHRFCAAFQPYRYVWVLLFVFGCILFQIFPVQPQTMWALSIRLFQFPSYFAFHSYIAFLLTLNLFDAFVTPFFSEYRITRWRNRAFDVTLITENSTPFRMCFCGY